MTDDDLLYHYTSVAGLIGLLGNSRLPATMWLTQVQYMNDDAEFYHAFELARDEIIKLGIECPGVRKVISGMWGIPHGDNRWDILPVRGTVLHRYFSFSLSEKPDLLSQWRGYTPDGGYCIGFRFGELKRLAEVNGFKLVRCVYDENEKRSQISSKIRDIESALCRGDVDFSIGSISSMKESERAEGTARARIQMAINPMAPYFKHPSFEEEREWRIVGMVGANNPRARWRARGNTIVPYCELDIGQQGSHPLSAVEIIIGPGLDFEHTKHAIEMMKFERFGQLQVKASSSTLRR